MDQYLFALIAFALSLLRTVSVVVLAWVVLRQLDKSIDFNFASWWEFADDRSRSIYLGARCFAVFLAFALCMA